jgi:hypothetical protein
MSFFKNTNRFFSYKQYVSILLLAGIVLTFSCFDTKIIPGHDYVFHMSRIAAVSEALKEGIFPVRIYVDEVQFWGNPVGIFYPSLFIYIPALLSLLGFPIELCYNILIIIVFYLGIFFSWYGFSILTHSKNAGFFSTILYISSGYYLTNAFIRSSLGELIALSFMPSAIACIFIFINKPKVNIKAYVMGIISITAIVESHVLSSVFFVVFCIIHLAFNYKKISLIICKRFSILSTSVILLNAGFIVPFVLFYCSIPTRITIVADNINMFFNHIFPIFFLILFLAIWNSWLLLSVYMSVVIQLYGYKCYPFYKNKSNISDFFSFSNSYAKRYLSKYNTFLASGIVVFIITTSFFPWDLCLPLVKIFSFMQFPWRLWGIATLFFCICGGAFIYLLFRQIGTKVLKPAVLFLTFLICFTQIIGISHINPDDHWTIRTKIYWKRFPVIYDLDYLYKDINLWELIQQDNKFITDAEINDYHKKLTNISFSYYAKSDSSITLPLIYYPGYTAVCEDKHHVSIISNKNHLLMIPLHKGRGKVSVAYKGLSIFKIADFISFSSLVVFVCFIFTVQKRKAWNKFTLV